MQNLKNIGYEHVMGMTIKITHTQHAQIEAHKWKYYL